MSAPSTEFLGFVPFAVLGASLLGSMHCVAMCGGLAISVGRTRVSVAKYHLGRLAGYLVLGALAGKLGEATLAGSGMSLVSWIATTLLAGSFLFMGIAVWKGRGVHLFALPAGWTAGLFRKMGARPLGVGLLSALLPCGWLHGFVLAAVATRGPVSGAILLLSFWIGTLPALSFSPWIVEQLIRPLAVKLPRFSAVLLIAAGVSCLVARAAPLAQVLRGQEAGACHEVGEPASGHRASAGKGHEHHHMQDMQEHGRE